MPSYRVYNANRAATIAAEIVTGVAQVDENVRESDASLLTVFNALYQGIYKAQNDLFEREGLDKEAAIPATAPAPAAAPAAGGIVRQPTIAEQGGIPGQQGAKGLSPKQVSFINKMVPDAQKNGYPGPVNSADDVAAVFAFAERDALINGLRLYAYYNGDIAAYNADTQNAGKAAPQVAG